MSEPFKVDVVATPHLDLFGAAAQDLKYYTAAGKYPMQAKSAMAREQEKLNKFLQYVNESFIIKGFSRSAAREESGITGVSTNNSVNVMLDDSPYTMCDFRVAHGSGAQMLVLFSLSGEAARLGSAPAYVTVKLYEDNTETAVFRQSYPEDCYLTFGLPFLLAGRNEGVSSIRMTAQVSGGEVYLLPHGLHASVLKIE